ncbi:MAG: NAD(P)-dependent oxidoreductase [Verrucomicrobia bacterium]|nr:NAD(P)-dependent oxidoreductase [Verrucomicrobiota bacterium]
MTSIDAQPNPPNLINSEAELDALLTRPGLKTIEAIGSVSSPLVILGAGGKMGPTLAVLAKRAALQAGRSLRVVAASRFSDVSTRKWLENEGVETHQTDVLEPDSLRELPDTDNVIYLVGLKFGTQDNPSLTWAVNTLAPAHAVARYPGARIVALSTGNVYPLSPVTEGGSIETAPLTPLGEYANAAVARERVFEYLSRKHRTPIVILRLNYAVELRYGVLFELARKVHDGIPIPLENGFFNCIWQGDANELILRSLALAASPPSVFNLTGTETLSVRSIALALGEHLGRAPIFEGSTASDALLSNASRLHKLLGNPTTPLNSFLRWTAHWVRIGGRALGKSTKFEVRDGRY